MSRKRRRGHSAEPGSSRPDITQSEGSAEPVADAEPLADVTPPRTHVVIEGAPSAPRPEPGRDGPLRPRSTVSGVRWPALAPPGGALLLALQHQFGESERWPLARTDAAQFDALGALLAHATATIPYYGQRDAYAEVAAAGALDANLWRRLPVLTRGDVQEAGNDMGSKAAPADHLPLYRTVTAGTTGAPLQAVGTKVTAALWQAVTLRALLWHERDVRGTLAVIRTEGAGTIPAEGATAAGWGDAAEAVFETGPCVALGGDRPVDAQAAWLVRQQPDYLLSRPSNLLALAEHCIEHAVALPALKGLTSYGEPLTGAVRDSCRRAWGAEIMDMYSTQEVGYVSLQCPASERHHVQSEVAYVEVVNDSGEPCGPGEVGRVLVSTLHNYAMPLLRYDVGDLAEVGEPCDCGRTLPVLNRIVGRA